MKRLLIAPYDGLLCATSEDSAGVIDLYAARLHQPDYAGAVVQATVTRLLPGQGAAIVAWAGQEGYWRDAKTAKAGESVRLQIKHDAHDDKLAQLARDIVLPGRFLLHLPLGKGVKLSRHNSMTVPEALAGYAGGWIVRRHAATASTDQLLQEAQALAALGQQSESPAPTVWQRAIIEHGAEMPSILVEEATTARELRGWLQDFAPDLLPLVQIAPDTLDWEALFAAISTPYIALPDGARLTIESTRAFWSVDVDAGAAGNALAVNLSAARELARQMRLRAIGGVVVVDFISMPTAAARHKLLAALRQAVANDPAGVEIFGISKLGLVELTRTRRGRALAELLPRS